MTFFHKIYTDASVYASYYLLSLEPDWKLTGISSLTFSGYSWCLDLLDYQNVTDCSNLLTALAENEFIIYLLVKN